MKHILLVGNTAWSMYNFRRNLMQHLVKLGYKVSVLAPSEADFDEKMRALGVDFYDLPLSAKGTNPISDLALTWRIRNYIKKLKPDFAFFYTIKPNIYGGFAAKLCKLPYIAVTTGLGYTFVVDNLVSKIARFLYKLSFKNAESVWFLNDDDKRDFLKYKLLPEEKCFVLRGEGVNTKHFELKTLPKNKKFLLMARMLWDKGVGEFVEAARILKKEYPEAEFNLLGFLNAENPAAISEEQINAWEQEGVVNYLGVTKDVRPYLEESISMVLPSSYREGVPMTLLEAASMGRILVTTDNVGCRDAVDDSVNGFLVPVKDPVALADAMRKVIEMTYEEKVAMGLAGRKKVENEFADELVVKIYENVLNEYLS
ncbi:MAG: glycosyltransferase family 4 protein [Paludibacteraceae bacterium]|nr:glycosyltransferase family 4 protein [Paludibacteraceae bacterium]